MRRALGAGLLLLLGDLPAEAALFSRGRRIQPQGEQILLEQDGKRITATHVLTYQGRSEDVAWVLPVPSRPTVSAGDATDEQLIVGARTRVLGLLEERRMLRLAVRELDACTWTWGHPPAGTDGAEASWDLIRAARESVAAAHKYRTGEEELPEVAALRAALAGSRE